MAYDLLSKNPPTQLIVHPELSVRREDATVLEQIISKRWEGSKVSGLGMGW